MVDNSNFLENNRFSILMVLYETSYKHNPLLTIILLTIYFKTIFINYYIFNIKIE